MKDRAPGLVYRVLGAWLVLIAAEVVNGALRTGFVEPVVGDLPARQIGVLVGSVLILAVTWLLIDWLGARSTIALLGVGCTWVVLTVLFEVGLGRLVFAYSWRRIASDFDILQGGLLPFGLLVMALAPLLAARLKSSRY